MAIAYPGANPSQAWANELVDAINATGSSYQMWSGTLAATVTLTALQFRSIKPSVALDFTGAGGVADLVLSWDGDTFSVPRDGHYTLFLQVGFGSVDTGNRMVSLVKNPAATTYATGTDPGAPYIRMAKFAPTTDSASGIVQWSGWLTPADKIMCLLRSTSGVTVTAAGRDTYLSVEFKRSAR